MHSLEILGPVVVISAQVEAAVNDIKQKFAAPVGVPNAGLVGVASGAD